MLCPYNFPKIFNKKGHKILYHMIFLSLEPVNLNFELSFHPGNHGPCSLALCNFITLSLSLKNEGSSTLHQS